MKGLSVHLLLFFLQIYSASKLARGSSIGKRSNAGFLTKTKSGKTFLQVSGKKTRITKDKRKESGNDNSNSQRNVEPRFRLNSTRIDSTNARKTRGSVAPEKDSSKTREKDFNQKMIGQEQRLKRPQRQKLAKLKSRCDSLVNLDSIVVPRFTNTVRE